MKEKPPTHLIDDPLGLILSCRSGENRENVATDVDRNAGEFILCSEPFGLVLSRPAI